MNAKFVVDDLMQDIAKELPDDTPYEVIKKIAAIIIDKSILMCQLYTAEKNELKMYIRNNL